MNNVIILFIKVIIIITLIYIILHVLKFIFNIIKDEYDIRKYYKKIDFIVLDFMDKIKFGILINGPVGSGKSTQQNMLSHYCTIDLFSKVNDVIQQFKENYYFLDFNLIDCEIEKLYSDYMKLMIDDEKIQYHELNIQDSLFDKYIELFSDKFNDNGIDKKTFKKDFGDYIFAYCRLKNNHYVVANYKLYSFITDNYAYGFEDKMLCLKDCYLEKSLYIDKYMVICKDENSLSEDDYYLNYKNTYKQDNGKHLFMRLIRHIFEGTVRYITTDQDANGMVANQRKILDTFIYVEGLKIVCDRKTLTKFIVAVKGKITSLERCYANIFISKDNRILYLNSNNNFKKFKYLLKKLQANITSRSLILYTDRIYKNSDDCANLVSNTNSEDKYKMAQLIGPIQWAFGSADTYEFHYIYRWFQSQYGRNFWNLNEFKEIVSQSMLDKKVDSILHKIKKENDEASDNNDSSFIADN